MCSSGRGPVDKCVRGWTRWSVVSRPPRPRRTPVPVSTALWWTGRTTTIHTWSAWPWRIRGFCGTPTAFVSGRSRGWPTNATPPGLSVCVLRHHVGSGRVCGYCVGAAKHGRRGERRRRGACDVRVERDLRQPHRGVCAPLECWRFVHVGDGWTREHLHDACDRAVR